MSETVRLARRADGPAALALWEALHAEHEALDDRYRISADASARWATDFRDWVGGAGHRIWIVEREGRAVGLLTAHLYQPAPTFEPYTMVYVDDLYLDPSVRGRGLARQLLDEVRAWAAASGATEIRAGVLAANAEGHAFWARQGAVDYYVTVTLREGEPPAR